MPAFIPDGYTREGYIAAALPEDCGVSPYEALEFTYRAATLQERCSLDGSIRIVMKNADIDATCQYKAEQLIRKFVADHIQGWNLKSVGIHPVPISASSVEGMNDSLFTRLYRIIRGDRLNDKKPEDKEQPLSDDQMAGNLKAASGSSSDTAASPEGTATTA